MFLPKFLSIGLLGAASLGADVTLRYKTTFQFNPSLPPQMTQEAMKGIGDFALKDSAYQLKEGKGASQFGKMRAIIDFTSHRLTLIDPEQKRITTTSADELTEVVRKMISDMPAEARAAMASMKSTAESRVTGRTETIQGIQAEEREVTIEVEGPAIPNMPPGPMFKLGIQLWTAKKDEVLRVPALREYVGHNLWAYATMSPAGNIQKMMQQLPGMGDGFGKIVKEMEAANAALLRSNFKMWMPAVAAVMKQLPPEKNPFGDKFDAAAPFMEMAQELVELSAAPIPESVFAIPEGYQQTSVAEMLKAMTPRTAAPAK